MDGLSSDGIHLCCFLLLNQTLSGKGFNLIKKPTFTNRQKVFYA